MGENVGVDLIKQIKDMSDECKEMRENYRNNKSISIFFPDTA